jgi:hypothetical protein
MGIHLTQVTTTDRGILPRKAASSSGYRSEVDTHLVQIGLCPFTRGVLKAPAGKFGLVVVDLFSHEDYLMEDYDYRDEAFKIASHLN